LHLGKEAFNAGDYSLGKAPQDTRETLDRTHSYTRGNIGNTVADWPPPDLSSS
jgi:hypothetical protein